MMHCSCFVLYCMHACSEIWSFLHALSLLYKAKETYLAKVEHLAKLRRKQEEDKALVKLHTFNHRNDVSALISSGNIKTLKCLELFSCPLKEVFCNDIRDSSAINYSEPILDWLGNSKKEALAKWGYIVSGIGKSWKVLLDDGPVSKLPNFRSVNMEKTRFCDFRFGVGAEYLYCHQGDCKHIIVVRDMRLIHPEDAQNCAAYPLVVYQPKAILKKCSVCRIYKATKVTLDDKLAGKNPCYFCDECYYLLHYSADGTLLYNKFEVYDYLQDYY